MVAVVIWSAGLQLWRLLFASAAQVRQHRWRLHDIYVGVHGVIFTGVALALHPLYYIYMYFANL